MAAGGGRGEGKALCGAVADPEPLLGLIEKHRAELWGTPERHREWRTDLRGTRREVVIRAFAELAFADEALAVRIADRFTDIREEEAQPVEGGLETVTGFRDAGVRTALMTNGEAAVQRAKIERFGLDALFDHMQIEGEAGVGKPEPAAFEMLLTAVEIEAREIWMVGDNLDVGSRGAATARTVETGGNLTLLGADRMKPPNSILSSYGTTVFTVMSALALEHDAINLGQGFPDTDGPADIREAAGAASMDGPNQYPPMMGIPELRQAVAEHNKRFYGLEVDWQTETLVTSGATEAIAASLFGLIEPGDEAVLIEPLYDCYLPILRRAGGVPKLVRLEPPDWELPRQALAEAF